MSPTLVIDTIGRELEVSPMPVREAIRRLEAELQAKGATKSAAEALFRRG